MPGLSTEPSTVSREVWGQSGEAAEKQSCSQPWRSSGGHTVVSRVSPEWQLPPCSFPSKLSRQTALASVSHSMVYGSVFQTVVQDPMGHDLQFLFLNVYFCLLIGLHWVLVAGSGIFSCIWDLIPWPGIEPGFPELQALNINPWATRQVSWLAIF